MRPSHKQGLGQPCQQYPVRQRAHLMLGGGRAQPRHVVLAKAVTQQLQHARRWLCVCLPGLCGNTQGPVGRFGPRGAPIQIPLRVLQSSCGLESFTSWHPCVRAGNLQGLVKQFRPAGAARICRAVLLKSCPLSLRFASWQCAGSCQALCPKSCGQALHQFAHILAHTAGHEVQGKLAAQPYATLANDTVSTAWSLWPGHCNHLPDKQ